MEEDIKKIDNFDGYFISNLGNVYSTKQGYVRKLKPFVDSRGLYLMIRIIK